MCLHLGPLQSGSSLTLPKTWLHLIQHPLPVPSPLTNLLNNCFLLWFYFTCLCKLTVWDPASLGDGCPDFHRRKLHLPILNHPSVCFKTKDIFLPSFPFFFFFFWWTYVNHFLWSTVFWGQGLHINCLCKPTKVMACASQIFNQYICCVSILCQMRSLICKGKTQLGSFAKP